MSEKNHSKDFITGIDEAGRGALAGPVVAACAVAPLNWTWPGLADSKTLSENKREKLFNQLVLELKDFAYCAISHEDIDRMNIRQATLEAMRQSFALLSQKTDQIIVDGCDAPILGSLAQVKADRDVVVVSAASIIAKVTRDRLMLTYHKLYPLYRFDLHKGYPTALHRELLKEHGPSPIHRLTYQVKG